MATFDTASKRSWKTTAGWNVVHFNNKGTQDMKSSTIRNLTVFKNSAYKDWSIPKSDFLNFVDPQQMIDALNFATDYIRNGGNTQDAKYTNGLKQIIGSGNQDQKIAYVDYILDKNADKWGYDSSGKAYEPITDKDGNISGYDTSKKNSNTSSDLDSDEASGLARYRDFVTQSLMTNPNGAMAQQYRDSMYGSIAGYENSAKATLASAEMDAYRALGQSQLQLENQIASERMNAIKSGVTSSQLASREIANMFAAQSGAAQVASTMAQNRAQMYNQFGQQRASVEGDLWNIINSNQQTAANAYAQLGAAQSSYASYINSYQAQLQAMMNAYNNDPYGYTEATKARSQADS